MQCLNCRSANPEEHRFCSQCGFPLRPGAPRRDGPADQERKHVTLLFADLSGSLSLLADRDPEDARHLLLAFLDLVIAAVREADGIVNQVMGDGIMAMFGAPVADEHHALRACMAAVRIHETVARYEHDLHDGASARFRVRVGINSGEVVVAERGEGLDFQYTAFGEAAHLAARLEALAAPGKTLISGSTHRLVEGQVLAEPRGSIEVRGLTRKIEVFELRGVRRGRLERRSSVRPIQLVGRAQEVALLRRSLQRAADGSGQVVTLVGEPGVGKSRLVAECLSEAARNFWLVLELGAAPYLRHVPYFAIRDALRAYFLLRDDDDPAARRRAILRQLQERHAPPEHVTTALLSVLGLTDAAWEQVPQAARRKRITDALVWLTLAESRLQPVVWVIEDLQWIDAETEAFLNALIAAVADSRVLLLMNQRVDHRAGLADAEHHTVVPVSRLEGDDLEVLLDAILGSDRSLDVVKQILAASTGGNPFFVEECVRTLVHDGTLAGRPGDYRQVGALADFMPTNVQDMLAARVDRLAPGDKRLLQAAALIGYDVDPLVLQPLSGLPPRRLADRMAELCAAGFLVQTVTFSGRGYAFAHALSHDVVYRSLLQETRRDLHARVVDILEALHGERAIEHAEVLGQHAVRGCQWAKAVHYLQMAGRKALAQSACRVAVSHLEAALTALAHLPDDREAKQTGFDLRLELRNALFPLARHAEMLVWLDQAERLAEELADPSRQARTAAHLCHCYWLTGKWDEAIAAGERALTIAEAAGELPQQVWSRFFKALAHYSLGELSAAIALLQANAAVLTGDLALNRFGGFSLPAVVVGDWLGWCLAERGEFAAALTCAEAGLKVAEAAGQPFDRVHGLLGVGGVHLMQGNVVQAKSFLGDAIELCDRTQVISVRPRVAASLAYALALGGSLEDAVALGELAAKDAGDLHQGVLGTLCRHRLAEVVLLAGRHEEALQHARAVLAACGTSHQRGLEAWTLRLIGEVQAARAGPEAGATLELALGLARDMGMQVLVAHCHRLLGVAALGRGEVDRAAQAGRLARRLYRDLGMDFWLERLPSAQESAAQVSEAVGERA